MILRDFLNLPANHLTRIAQRLNTLQNAEIGFLKRSGDLLIDNQHYFIKELRMERVIIPAQDYIKLYIDYYKKLNNVIETYPSFGLWQIDGKIIEIQPFIEKEDIMMRGNVLSWKTLRKAYLQILTDIDKIQKTYGQKNFTPVGVETAIWNFSTEGKLYDFNPVRLYNEDCLFTTSRDADMVEKTKFRNFSPIGMKINLLATIGIAVKNKDFILKDNPTSWFLELKAILKTNIKQQDSSFLTVFSQRNLPKWHPLQIISNFQKESEK